MKVAYVTTYDAADVRNWSGIGYYMAKALQGQGVEMDFIGPLKDPAGSLYFKAKQVILRKVFDKGYQFYREPYILKSYAAQIAEKLKQSDADVVLCPGAMPISYLECDRPVVFWIDSAFGALHDFYPGHSHLLEKTKRDGRKAEQLALTRCSLAIYSSEWAASVARERYDVDPAKIKVVPFGANVDGARSRSEVEQFVDLRSEKKCKLLFIGVEWKRKGGDVAYRVADALNRQGIPTMLTVVGCKPILHEAKPEWLRTLGFISKSSPEGRKQLDALLAESHFLIVPSRAEAFGIVYCEANSFGVPCLATEVGGIPTIIKDNVNGRLFSLKASIQEYCDYVVDLMTDRERYRQLALRSFEEYEMRLNWGVAGAAVKRLLSELCSEKAMA